MASRWLDAHDPAWHKILETVRHDIYHLPGYVAIHCLDPTDQPVTYVYEDSRGVFFLPLVLRAIPDSEWRDAAAPYGFPGPLVSITDAEDEREFLHDVMKEMVRFFESEGIVSVFLRLHPFLGLTADQISGVGTVVHHGATVAIDLGQDETALWGETRANHRRGINRALRLGHRAYVDTGWEYFEEFLTIYQETMQRVNANPGYRIDRSYFESHRTALGEHIHLWIVEINDDVAAAAMFTECDGIVQYHFAGNRTMYASDQPTKLLLHEARIWAKARGNRVLNLGGGVGGEADSLLNFKLGFSKRTHPLDTWRLVTNASVYRELVTSRVGSLSGEPDDGGYFPAYRQGAVYRQPGQLPEQPKDPRDTSR